MYGIRQKECNKRAVVALISVAYRAPRLSLCGVPHFDARTCAVLIPLCVPHFDAIPERVPSYKAPQSLAFPRIVAVFL